MNSRERHEIRYNRRVAKRKAKVPAELDDFERVFTLENMYNAYLKSRLGVGWKASTQKYNANALFNVVRNLNQLRNGTYKTGNFYEFNLTERGKTRHIKSVHISERVVQKCLCDNSLVPMLSRSFIMDNGACQKNKGEHFTIRRLKKHLHSYYKENGTNEGYVLFFDFSKYFDNINHEKLKEIISSKYTDERLKGLIFKLIDDFGDKGLGLGSQISQICALSMPNKIDHFIKEKARIKHYGRYMDDGYLFARDKETIIACRDAIFRLCEELGIVINKKKTQIQKLNKPFKFLQKKFFFRETGAVIVCPAKNSVTRMRRKLKKLKKRYDACKINLIEIKQSVASWIGSMGHYHSYRQIKEIKALYENLFKESYV